jgi:hypothetical protein
VTKESEEQNEKKNLILDDGNCHDLYFAGRAGFAKGHLIGNEVQIFSSAATV